MLRWRVWDPQIWGFFACGSLEEIFIASRELNPLIPVFYKIGHQRRLMGSFEKKADASKLARGSPPWALRSESLAKYLSVEFPILEPWLTFNLKNFPCMSCVTRQIRENQVLSYCDEMVLLLVSHSILFFLYASQQLRCFLWCSQSSRGWSCGTLRPLDRGPSERDA